MEQAESYNKQGLQLVLVGRLEEAVDFFSKAIDIDPTFAASYFHRGEVYLSLNRIVEGQTDIQKAKDLRSGKQRVKKTKTLPAKIVLNEIESIYDKVYPSEDKDIDNGVLDFDDSYYDYVFSDDAIKMEGPWDQIVKPAPQTNSFPSILELIGGKKIEVASAILFQPTNNDISLLRKDGHVERVVSLDHLVCIRTEGIPPEFSKSKDDSCHVEIIETIDGNIYHESIHPDQDMENILFGFSTKIQARFIYTLIPVANIRKRCQERYLGDILLEKRFITDDLIKGALEEYQKAKNMKLGKIVAQKTRIIHSAIEGEIEKAKQGNVNGKRIGEILVASGLVGEDQLIVALQQQQKMHRMKIGEFLIEKGIVQERELYIALAEKFRLPFVDLRKQKVSKKILTLLPENFILQNEILPISLDQKKLTVAVSRPDVSNLREMIMKECQCKDVLFVLAQPTHLGNIINLLYNKMELVA